MHHKTRVFFAMDKKVAVINVVGLSQSLIGAATPCILEFQKRGEMQVFDPAFPAVTCSAQSAYLTGKGAEIHGIVGNGWYDREDAEVKFWKQSNHLVRSEKVWDVLKLKDPTFRCANLFWWYNMHSSVDLSITPRPVYPADGRKVFDIYTQPMGLREEIKAELGEFPFPSFWGPAAGIASSEWIAASAKWVALNEQPHLQFVYLPHLDYVLQREGPRGASVGQDLRAIDAVVGDLISFYQERGVEVVVLSEYGISEVGRAVHLNRIFRKMGWIAIKNELGLEQLDVGASKVFAVADHQVAHVYVQDESLMEEVERCLSDTEGVAEVRKPEHERAGDWVAVAEEDAWFTYYYWEKDELAPDFARCVDIHRKIGYDPVELFVDPELSFPKWKIAQFLLKKKLGFRALLDVIPLDATLVKGSHGRDQVASAEKPVVITERAVQKVARAEDVFGLILRLFE